MSDWQRSALVAAAVCVLGGLVLANAATAQNPTPQALKDPVALGAWLYQGQCVRCHGPYEQERIGRGKSEDALAAEIAGGGCQIRWARDQGGPLTRREIKALTAYIMTWEELGGPPSLPELPPQPTPTPTPTPVQSAAAVRPSPTPTPIAPVMDERIQLIVAANEVAHGAWLYTHYCYRCHQAYAETRMGRGARMVDIKRVVENGKTSTQMTAFSRTKGGPLRTREIAAILAYIGAWERLDAAPALPEGVLVPPTPDPAALIPIALPTVPPVTGDVTTGAALYAAYCQRCHGEDGHGGIGPRLQRNWPMVRADLRIRSTVAQGVAGSLMRAWAQDNDGPLSAQSVDDLTALIMAWSSGRPVSTADGRSSDLPQSDWQGMWGILLLMALLALVGGIALINADNRPPRC